MATQLLCQSGQTVCVEDGKIVPPQEKCDRVIELGDVTIAPGLIDLQVNGGFGIDLLKEPGRVEELAQHLAAHGYAGFLPTLISATPEEYANALPHLQPRKVEGGAEILGIHLEGPLLNEEKIGAHHPPPVKELPCLDGVKLVTLAPECEGAAEAIELLKRRGILVAAGHTTSDSLPSEIDLVTHLCNAMPSLHHRSPGLVGEVLTGSAIPFTLISDALHLHPTMIKLIHRCRPEGVVLISDGMAAMGLEDGCYSLGAQQVIVKKQRATLAGSETLAGATLSLDQCATLYCQLSGCSRAEAIEAATQRPAKLLGLDHRLGTLNPGGEAKLISYDRSLKISTLHLDGIS